MKHRSAVALLTLAAFAALAVPRTLNNVVIPHAQDESTFPAAAIYSDAGAGGLLFGTDAGRLYVAVGTQWIPVRGELVGVGSVGVYDDGGTIGVSCATAASSTSGCIVTGAQTLPTGAKTFPSAVNSLTQVYAPTITALGDSQALNFTNDDSLGTYITGQRSNTHVQADVTLQSKHKRDAGSIVTVINGTESSPKVVLHIDPEGSIIAAVGQNSSNGVPAFQDGSGASGHVALTCSEGLYTSITGQLGGNTSLWESDGGRPIADGGTWVQTLSDGGTYYAYGGRHGGVTITDPNPRYAGQLIEFKNNLTGGTATDSRSWIDYNGAYGQSHQLSRSQFGSREVAVPVQAGSTYFGQAVSSLMYDFGNSEDSQHYFVQGAAVTDGGTDWRQLPYTNDVLAMADDGTNARPDYETMKRGSSTFIAGAKALTWGASPFHSTPRCWCTDTSGSAAGAVVGCGVGAASLSAGGVTFVGTGTDTFDWWCTGTK